MKPFPEDKDPKLKVKKQALKRQLDLVFDRLKFDYYDKTVIQLTLDNNYIRLPDNSNNRASGCLTHPLAGRLIGLVSTPKKYKELGLKKDCDIKKMQSARKVLESRRCKFCGSEKVIKWGKQNGNQRYKCKECNHVFDQNQKFPRMRENFKIIATALDLYYEGLSLRKVSRQIKKFYNVDINASTFWRWIQKYTSQVKEFTDSLTPKTKRGIWHVDETAIKIKGEKGPSRWYWDCIDHDSRFIIGTHMSKQRYIEDAQAIFSNCKDQTDIRPRMVICDGLYAYKRGLYRNYGWSEFSKINFISKAGIAKKMPSNNNRIERYHNTIKARTKIMRGMQNPMGILDGFTIHYNFIREHQTLGTTPARISGIYLPMEDGWGDMIQFATIHQNS